MSTLTAGLVMEMFSDVRHGAWDAGDSRVTALSRTNERTNEREPLQLKDTGAEELPCWVKEATFLVALGRREFLGGQEEASPDTGRSFLWYTYTKTLPRAFHKFQGTLRERTEHAQGHEFQGTLWARTARSGHAQGMLRATQLRARSGHAQHAQGTHSTLTTCSGHAQVTLTAR